MAHLLMYNRLRERLARLLAVSLVVVLAGCVQKYPVAYYAHPGGTVVLGLGGIQRNTYGATNLQASDLTISIVDNNNVTTTLQAGSVFKAFPDYSSQLSLYSVNKNKSESTAPGINLVPFDGGWFVSVTLPGTLVPGSYWINIASPKLHNTTYSHSIYAEGDLSQIQLQVESIPSGMKSYYSQLNSSYNSQFSYYPPQPGTRLDVSPPASALASLTSVGGLQLVINFPAANYDPTLPVIALPYSHNPSISLLQNIVDNSNGTKSLVVLLTAPQGFVTNANRTALTPVLSDLSLSFLFYPASGINSNPTQQLGDFKIDYSRSNYYDTSGNVIATLTPTMTFQ